MEQSRERTNSTEIRPNRRKVNNFSQRLVFLLHYFCHYLFMSVRKWFFISAARKFCPVRYAALQRWFEFSRSTLSQLEPKLLQMFYWPRGPLKTTPVCPVAISANFMPTTSAQTYSSSFRTCMRPASFRIPFFLDRMGPKYSEWTTSAHEARPGHHLQSQGHLENFL